MSALTLPGPVTEQTAYDNSHVQDEILAWIVEITDQGNFERLSCGRLEPSTVPEALRKPSSVGSISGEGQPKDIAGRLYRMLSSNANSCGGYQVYEVACYRIPDDPRFRWCAGTPQDTRRFRFGNPALSHTEAQEVVDRAVAALAVRNAEITYRHAEEMHRIAIDAVERKDANLRSEIDRLYRVTRDKDEAWQKMIDARIKEIENAATKRIELIKAEHEAKIWDLGFKHLEMAVPALMTKLLPSGGSKPLADDAVSHFLKSLSPLQLEDIKKRAQFTPVQGMAFQSLVEAYLSGKNTTPAALDALIEQVLDQLTDAQAEVLRQILRPEQQEEFMTTIVRPYYERKALREGKTQ